MTHEQIAQCQDAGNAAYTKAQERGESLTQCSGSYYAAYHQMERSINETTRPYIVAQGVTNETAAALGDEMVAEFHRYLSELNDDEIAALEAMTAETARADDYDSHTEGHW